MSNEEEVSLSFDFFGIILVDLDEKGQS